jgi:nucleotide-binding universal stress UspA family protein
MHILLPFDIVPVDSRIPQSAFGFSPSSERAVEYALEAYGAHDQLEVTAIHLSADSIDLEENIGAADIENLAENLNVSVDVTVESVTDVESMSETRQRILDIVEQSDIDTVVIGYTEDSFIDSVFSNSTPQRILERDECPVVLVP